MSENSSPSDKASHTAKPAQKCEWCHENLAKYRCPGCMLKTCSLGCSKAHKSQTNCSGKRDRTQFVKRGEYDENTLISDYTFLQDLKRDHVSTLRAGDESGTKPDSRRTNTLNRKTQTRPSNSSGVNLNRAQRNIASRAKNQRHVAIRYMSPGIQRHDQNKTIWASSKSRLVWTLELSVPEVEAKPNKWIESGFHDVCKLGDLWSRLLDYSRNELAGLRKDEETGEERAKKRHRSDVVRIQLPSDDGEEHPFRSSISNDMLTAVRQKFESTPIMQTTWLIRIQDMPANKPTFCVLDPLQPLYTQLRYQTVIEFPTIYVFRKVPTIWDGHEITIKQHLAESSGVDQKTPLRDQDNDAGNGNVIVENDSELLPENTYLPVNDNKPDVTSCIE